MESHKGYLAELSGLTPMLSRERIVRIVVTFVTVAVLTFFLLSLFPFYPLSIMIGLSLVLGLVAIELPGLALIFSVLLSVVGAMYQNAFVGLVFLFVLVLFAPVISGWLDMAIVTASWVLAFFATPSLAILPTVLAGYHDSREDALKIGAISGISLFLLGWARNIAQTGFVLVPSLSSYTPKPIPDPWQLQAFLPGVEVFSPDKLTGFYAPLVSSIGDYRIYVIILGWAVAGFLIAYLARRWRGYMGVAAGVVGVLPSVLLALIFAQAPLLQVGAALVGTVVLAFGYVTIKPMITVPALPTFRSLEGLVTTGIPQKYTLLLGAPACDERNMVVEQFMQSGVDKNIPAYMVTSDVSFAQAAAQRFGDKLTVLVANPRAAASEKNIIPLPTGVQNLTALNIELVKLVKDRAGSGARVVLDVISEVMLAQKMLTTRKWVSDLVPRFDNWGFTVLGVFNPSLHAPEEVQGLIELFNGYVQIFEKDYEGRTRKLIAVRKMADLQYNENELLIERAKLETGKKRSGLMKRLGK